MTRFISTILAGLTLSGMGLAQDNRGSFESLLSVKGDYRQVASTKLFSLPDVYILGNVDVRAWGGINITENSALTSGFSLTKDFPLSESNSVSGFAGVFWVAAEADQKMFSDYGLHIGLTWTW